MRTLKDLEERHGWRRETVWARCDEARLAQALEHLAVAARTPALPSRNARALAQAYTFRGMPMLAAHRLRRPSVPPIYTMNANSSISKAALDADFSKTKAAG